MSRCLVLGANGFIGSHVVDELVEKGHQVVCFDRFKTDRRAFKAVGSKNIEIFNGNFLSKDSLSRALKDVEYVFHFISTTNPMVSDNDPMVDIDTNIRMSIELFQLCVEHKVKKVVFASSGGTIYGLNSSSLVAETTLPLPLSPYAIGKLTVEHYLRYFSHKFGLEYLAFRISNPYGPRQNVLSGQGVIPIFLHQLKENKPIKVYGDGSMVRDYLYVEDLATMLTEAFSKNVEPTTFNLGSGVGHSVNEIIDTIESVTSMKFQKEFVEAPKTFVDRIVLDTSLFKSHFGLQPTTSLETGILKTWQNL